MEFSRDQLLLAIRGDREAVTAITGAFLPRVYGLCLRLAGRRDLAEEATQETFVRALRALPGLRKPESFGSWILMIAANTTKEILRQAMGGTQPLDGDLEDDTARGSEEPERRKKALDVAIAQLETDERELFLLHTLEGVSLDDLARDRQMTLAAIKSRVHRIREKVRQAALAHLDRQGESP